MVSIFPPLKQLGLNSNRNFCITPELYKKIVCTDQYSKFLFAVFINTVTTLNIIKKIATVLHVGSLLPKAGSILGVTLKEWILTSVQFSSEAQLCLILCDPMNCSTPGLPINHQLLGFTQTHVHRVGDAIQPSHPLSSPSPPAPNPSQHQGLFQ